MTAQEAKELYKGKFFYELVKGLDKINHQLIGPMEDIRFLVPHDDGKYSDPKYKYVQIGKNGLMLGAFTEEEMVVLDFDINAKKGDLNEPK